MNDREREQASKKDTFCLLERRSNRFAGTLTRSSRNYYRNVVGGQGNNAVLERVKNQQTDQVK